MTIQNLDGFLCVKVHNFRLQSTDAVKSRGRYNMQCAARLNAPRTTCLPCEILDEKPSL